MPQLVKAADGKVWSPYYAEITAAMVNEAHRLGLTVVVWAVNDPGDIARMLEFGVGGIISDYPDRLRRLAQERCMSLPAPTPFPP